MTGNQMAGVMRRLADALEKVAGDHEVRQGRKPGLDGEMALGAALFWAYLRDLFTASRKEVFAKEDVLVLLEMVSRDADVLPPGICELVTEDDGDLEPLEDYQ